MNKDFYSPKELATKVGVSQQTIYRAIKKGKILPIRIGRNSMRIPHSEIERLGVFELRSIVDKLVEEKLKEKN